MIPYWILFFIPAMLAFFSPHPVLCGSKKWNLNWKLMFLLFVLMVGLRHEVGGDWFSYVGYIYRASYQTLYESLLASDPAYGLLNWIGSRIRWGVYFVNMVSALFFSWGLVVFCRRQPRPWLALTVAIPYLVTVVAMGYTRQGTAIGLVMVGLVALTDRKLFRFAFFIALAATFHKSAVILMPLAALASSKNKLLTVIWVALFTGVLYWLYLQEAVETLQRNYLEAEYQSAGAAIRVSMNAVPAALFLLYRSRFQMLSHDEKQFWTGLSLLALGFVVLLIISPSSTAVDRVALYMIPLQMFVLSRIPEVFGSLSGKGNGAWNFAVVGYSAIILFVWLFFATHAHSWLPYQFYPWFWLTL